MIRCATLNDAEKLRAIYVPYVEKTAITFEYEVPTVEEFSRRIARVQEKYPWLVMEEDGEIIGYAYAGAFKDRPAYDWAVETTIYVREDRKGRGIGRGLYLALEKALALQNILNLNACIAYPAKEDQYLTRDSVHFHEHMGYRMVGRFFQCGCKAGRWYDMVWMEKHLGPHEHDPAPVRPFVEVRELLRF